MDNFKRTIKFHDAEDLLVVSELEITHRNGFPEFTMSNERNGNQGQTDFVPKDGYQTELYNIWKQYHLNGMNSGLPIQTKAIIEWEKKGNSYEFDKACEYLKSINLYEVDLKSNLPENMFITGKETIQDGETYRYGSGWIHCNLPEGFIESLINICHEIEIEESNRFEDGIEDWDDIFDDNLNLRDEVSNLEDEKIIALGKHLDLTPSEANEDIELDRDCLYSYSGQEYLVCTDLEADELWDECLENYIEDCILPELEEGLRRYFDNEAWKRDARYDSRGDYLNTYNGSEYEEKVNGTWYYIYRQN